MKRIWQIVGRVCFWLAWPLIWLYVRITPARARVVITHNGEVLVVKNWLSHGRWTLPGGGVQHAELPIDAAVREIAEELGIDLDKSQLVEKGLLTSIEAGAIRSRYYLFFVELKDKPAIAAAAHEIMDVAWVDANDLQAGKIMASTTLHDSLTVWLSGQNLVS